MSLLPIEKVDPPDHHTLLCEPSEKRIEIRYRQVEGVHAFPDYEKILGEVYFGGGVYLERVKAGSHLHLPWH